MTTQQTDTNGLFAFQPEEVMVVFQTLAMGFHNKKLTFNEFREYLTDLMLVDRKGMLWTIGAGSGSWYRRDGETWVKNEPPNELFSVYRVIRKMKATMPECPSCHKRVPRDYRFCPHCGATVTAHRKPEAATAPPQQPASVSRPAPSTKPVYCRKCGKPMQPSSKFCTACGAPRRQ